MAEQPSGPAGQPAPVSVASSGAGASIAGATVPVRFAGDGAGTGALTWSQRELWDGMQLKRTWLPIGAAMRLPAGSTVDGALTELRFVMSRYPSLRTRVRLDPDGPRQVVAGGGETQLEIVDAPDDADPATDWPLRMAVIRHRGTLTHRVWVFCHLAIDGTGIQLMLQDLAAGPGPPGNGAPAPLEQVRWQRSPAGQRRSQAGLRHWEAILRRLPAQRFPARPATPGPRYRLARLDSPATLLAARMIAARTGVEVASVLLAVYAVALARVTGINPVVVQPTVSNRFRPGLARTVSPIIQFGLCVLALPDGTVDEAVAYTRHRAIAAYKYAYHDPLARAELVARLGRERAEEIDLSCYFNDSRLPPPEPPGPPPTPAQLRAAAPASQFEWLQQQDHRPFDRLFVTLENVPDTAEIEVAGDLHHLAPSDLERCVRGMEEVAVAAALDPATRTQVPAARGWL